MVQPKAELPLFSVSTGHRGKRLSNMAEHFLQLFQTLPAIGDIPGLQASLQGLGAKTQLSCTDFAGRDSQAFFLQSLSHPHDRMDRGSNLVTRTGVEGDFGKVGAMRTACCISSAASC